jgi:hypothetical protein
MAGDPADRPVAPDRAIHGRDRGAERFGLRPVSGPQFRAVPGHFGWDRNWSLPRSLGPGEHGVGRGLWWWARLRGDPSSDAAYRASGCVPESGKLLKPPHVIGVARLAVGRDRVDVLACCGGEGREHDLRACGDLRGSKQPRAVGSTIAPRRPVGLAPGSGAVRCCRCALRAASCGYRRRCGGRARSGCSAATSTRRSRGAVPPAHRSRERLVPARSEDCCWPRFAAEHVGVASAPGSN